MAWATGSPTSLVAYMGTQDKKILNFKLDKFSILNKIFRAGGHQKLKREGKVKKELGDFFSGLKQNISSLRNFCSPSKKKKLNSSASRGRRK